MGTHKLPSTGALRTLRGAGVDFTVHRYTYEARGGTAASARALGVEEGAVIKTLIFEDQDRRPMVVLMHGTMEVSTKALARHLGAKRIQPCRPDVAQRHSGYMVGGTSPFGTRKALPVYAESSIFALETLYINGGQRGLLVAICPAVLDQLLEVERVEVGISGAA